MWCVVCGRSLFAARRVLCVARCSLRFVCCLLLLACNALFTRCCLFAIGCVLIVVLKVKCAMCVVRFFVVACYFLVGN